MSESKTKDNISDSGSKELLPKVLVGSSGKKRDLNCDYMEADFMFAQDENMTTPELFNSFRAKTNYDLFVYLSDNYDFTNTDSLTKLVKILWSDTFIKVSGLYSDISTKVQNKSILLKSYPSFSKNIITKKSMMNVPFIVKSSVAPTFHTNFEQLFLFDGLLNLFDNNWVLHTPYCFFNLSQFDQANPKIKQELDLLYESYK